MKKIHLLLIASLTIASQGTACAAGKRRPQPQRYTVGIVYPEDGGGFYNKTGKKEDNFFLRFDQMRLHRCYPEYDHTELMKELEYYRGLYGRPGSLHLWTDQSLSSTQ